MTTVLVADDNAKIVEVLAEYLRADGFTPLTALDGETAADMAETTPPDIALVDIMLPGIDGLTLTRRFLSAGIPVILISARSDEADRIGGLELGADDYVTKPFSPREVVTRVHTVLRRVARTGGSENLLCFGELEIDAAGRTVRAAGKPVDLTRTEFDILYTLASQAGTVFTREQLSRLTTSQPDEVDLRRIDTHVKNIRRKLGDLSRGHIRTVFGVGYKLEP